VLVDTDRDEAQHVLVQPFLALDFRQRGRGGVDVEQGEMRLPVLAHPVGEGLHPPMLGLRDLAAELFDEALVLLGQFLDLLRGNVLSRQKYVFV